MRGQLTHRIWLRARTGVSEGMRFRKGARTFTIRAVRDPDETGRYLVCLCEEGAL
jgi:SPP1 family predicted phage head-tail adaptor